MRSAAPGRAAPRPARRLTTTRCESALLDLERGRGEAELALPTATPRLARRAAPAPVDHAPAGPGARLVLRLARSSRCWSIRRRNRTARRCPTAPAKHAQTRLHPPGDDVHHLRAYRAGDRAARDRMEALGAPRHAAGARIRAAAVGADIVLDWRAAARPRLRSAHLAGWRAGSTKPNATAAAIACCLPGQPPIGPGARRRASPRLPARAGAAARRRA